LVAFPVQEVLQRLLLESAALEYQDAGDQDDGDLHGDDARGEPGDELARVGCTGCKTPHDLP
jgi:hypothetical protein